jgi:hypothetical protein
MKLLDDVDFDKIEDQLRRGNTSVADDPMYRTIVAHTDFVGHQDVHQDNHGDNHADNS